MVSEVHGLMDDAGDKIADVYACDACDQLQGSGSVDVHVG